LLPPEKIDFLTTALPQEIFAVWEDWQIAGEVPCREACLSIPL
jgi:hypothetical protein